MELGLTNNELEILDQAANLLNLDIKTRKLSTSYFFEYKQKTRTDISDKLFLLANCAILAASKSQILPTLNGETIRGIGISITQIMRGNINNGGNGSNTSSNFSSEDFLSSLKDFVNTVNLDIEVANELRNIIQRFAFSYTFFNKYNNLLKSLDFKENISTSEEFIKNLSNFGWLLYISAKGHILQNRTELIESVYLLTIILSHMLYHLPNYIPIGYLDKPNRIIVDKVTKKKNEEAIQQTICELLKIHYNQEDLQIHQKAYNEYIQTLIDSDILRIADKGKIDTIYDTHNLSTNLKRLEQYYLKKLNHDDLDERFYIKEKKANAPGKFTPFAKQGACNKNINIQWNLAKNENPQAMKKTYNSHRILNYEISERVTLNSNLNEIKFANKSIPPSPFTKLVQATPMTTALEMYNWLIEKTKTRRTNNSLPPFLDQYCLSISEKFREQIITRAENLVEKVLLCEHQRDDITITTSTIASTMSASQKKIKDKCNQIVSLYYRAIEEVLINEEKKEGISSSSSSSSNNNSQNLKEILTDEGFNRAMIANAIETVFFVNNLSNVSFEKLMDLCEIQPFQFWGVIATFIHSDQQMPYPVKKHLHEIEVKILTNLAWKKGSIVHQIIKDLAKESKNLQINDELQKFSKTSGLNEATGVIGSTGSMGSIGSSHDLDFSRFWTSLNNGAEQVSISTTSKTQDFTKSQADGSQKPIKSIVTKPIEILNTQDLFFKRVLHHCALEVYQLCEQLHLCEKTAEYVWTVMKYILSTETNILIDRNMIQIILCTIYGICKIMHQPLKFQDIISKYLEMPNLNKNEVQEIIYNVTIKGDEKTDLIKFYNVVYISQMKNFLFSLINDKENNDPKPNIASISIKKPIIPALAHSLDSPLKESLPYYMQNNSCGMMMMNNKKKSPMIKGGMTPLTSCLYAESPKLYDNVYNPLKSRKMLNMDEPENYQSEVANKKMKNSHGMMEKIVEQNFEENDMDSSKKTSSKRLLFGTQNNSFKGASKTLNYDDALNASTSPITPSSNGFFGSTNRGNNLANGPTTTTTTVTTTTCDINNLPLFTNKINNTTKTGGILFNSIKGGKHLTFDDIGSNTNNGSTSINTIYNDNTSGNNMQKGSKQSFSEL